MIVRRIEDIIGTVRELKTESSRSRQLVTDADRLGFSMQDTLIRAGTSRTIRYEHHMEAAYCIAGVGDVEILPEGPHYSIGPGTLYGLDRHERHILRARTDMRMICIFNPALSEEDARV